MQIESITEFWKSSSLHSSVSLMIKFIVPYPELCLVKQSHVDFIQLPPRAFSQPFSSYLFTQPQPQPHLRTNLEMFHFNPRITKKKRCNQGKKKDCKCLMITEVQICRAGQQCLCHRSSHVMFRHVSRHRATPTGRTPRLSAKTWMTKNMSTDANAAHP